MTDAPVEDARELVALAEGRYRSPDRRETHYAVREADETASEALEALGEDETPAALELQARTRLVQSGVAARPGEDETARERSRQAARLGEAAGTERGLEVAADAWYELAAADDGADRDARIAADSRCVDAGRGAGTDAGRSRAYAAATGLASAGIPCPS